MRNQSTFKAFVAVCVFAALAGGCNEVRVNVTSGVRPDKPLRVAVLDFDSSTDSVETLLGAREVHVIDNAGVIVAEAVSTALVDVSQLRVVEGRRLRQAIAELKLTPDDALTPENLKKLGHLAGVDGVVVGYVSDFHWWQVGFCSGTGLAFTARMVDTATGEVIWSAAVHRNRGDNHNELLFDACAVMASKLNDKLD